MALYSCKKHGLTSVKMVCPHAVRCVETGVPAKTTVVQVGDLLVPVVHFCGDCLGAWERLSIAGERENVVETMIPVCGKCFDEVNTHDQTKP